MTTICMNMPLILTFAPNTPIPTNLLICMILLISLRTSRTSTLFLSWRPLNAAISLTLSLRTKRPWNLPATIPPWRRKGLEFQLSKAVDGNVSLHLDIAVVLVYVQTQVREMGFHFHRLVAQRNEIKYAKSGRKRCLYVIVLTNMRRIASVGKCEEYAKWF